MDQVSTGSQRLARLLRPRTVALIGGKPCAEIIRQCRRLGFEGDLWPVHPSLTDIEGHRVYPTLDELPGSPDAAFVSVNCTATVELVRALATRSTGGAVCYASGFAESGSDGRELQRELRHAAGEMPFLGPNCHGFVNYFDGAALWPEQQGGRREKRGIALLTQSGNIALNLTMQARGLPVGYVITLGNQARIDMSAAIEAVASDPRVCAIGLHLESIADPPAFLRAARSARERQIPIIALKSGRTALSARMALTHTASLAGEQAAADAFLRRAGVACVQSLPILLEALKLLHVHGPLPGRDIATMSCSGGEAGLAADAGATRGLRFPPLDERQVQRLTEVLPPLARASNPLDYHNFSWGNEATLFDIYSTVLQAGNDLACLILDFPREDRCAVNGFDATLSALRRAASATGARVAVVATLQENLPEHRSRELVEAGIAPLTGLEDAFAAAACAAEVHELGAIAIADILPNVLPHLPAETGVLGSPCAKSITLSEWDAKRALSNHGLPVPAGRLVQTAQAAVTAAVEVGFPVAVKSVGPTIAHKTDIGGVCLNLESENAVRRAAQEQLDRVGADLLIEAMVGECVAELLVGITRDPVFGLCLVLGSGGVLVELVGDRRVLMLPAGRAEILAAIDSLKASRLLAGYRGSHAGDREAAAEAALAIQRFALAEQARLLELEVNPLIVRSQGRGAVAVDAVIRLTDESSHA